MERIARAIHFRAGAYASRFGNCMNYLRKDTKSLAFREETGDMAAFMRR